MGIGVLFVLQKMGECTFFSEKGKVGKIAEEGFILRATYLLLIFVFINPRNITIQGIYKSNKFQISIDLNF